MSTKMRARFGLLFILLFPFTLFGGPPNSARSSQSIPVVVLELFTSQGCESCPAADSLLTRLGSDSSYSPYIIPIAYHVNFWDNLGWKDPFSRPEFSTRQLTYEAALGVDNFYTPQMIINGRAECIGSWEQRVKDEIDWAMNGLPGVNLEVRLGREAASPNRLQTMITAKVRREISSDSVHLFIAVLENNLRTNVTRGENNGRTLHNNYVTRIFEEVGQFSGERNSLYISNVVINLLPEWKKEDLQIAVLAQDPKTMTIHGGSAIKLSPSL